MFAAVLGRSGRAASAGASRSITRAMAAPVSLRALSTSPLLSTEQVQTLLNESDRVRLLDASWYLDKSRNGKQEFAVERIAGAAFFDIDGVADKSSGLPHMLPTPEAFERAMVSLGVSNDDTVVVYVGKNCFRCVCMEFVRHPIARWLASLSTEHSLTVLLLCSAARCWWTLKYFGHDSVHVMNGTDVVIERACQLHAATMTPRWCC